MPQTQDSVLFNPDSTRVDTVKKDSISVYNDSTAPAIIQVDSVSHTPVSTLSTATIPENSSPPKKKKKEEKRVVFKKNKLEKLPKELTISNAWLEKSVVKDRSGLLPEQKHAPYTDWFLIPIFLILVLLAGIKAFTNKKLRQYFNAIVSNRFIEQLMREEEGIVSPINISLFFIYLLGTSILVFNGVYLIVPTLFDTFKAEVFLYLVGALIIYFVLKLFAIQLSKVLFGSHEAFDHYSFQLILFTKVLGLVLVIPALFSSFGFFHIRELAIWVGLGLYGFFVTIRLIKSLVGGLALQGDSLYYLILYICTLEILPILLIAKSFVS